MGKCKKEQIKSNKLNKIFVTEKPRLEALLLAIDIYFRCGIIRE